MVVSNGYLHLLVSGVGITVTQQHNLHLITTIKQNDLAFLLIKKTS